ncbi:MAG: NAD-dependent deacylase [Robiginitalea sp.]|jgi:NAD-dependent deacetylase
MKKLVVLSGAGMSADSGLKTFRDSGGLWEGHDVMRVASPEGYAQNPELVLEFYNQRRRQLREASPNDGHRALASLESHFEVTIVTQNVDDLHERAGSTRVLHLHGELLKARSTGPKKTVYRWEEDIHPEDRCEDGYPLRPHIVWFGEPVPLLEAAAELTLQADLLVVVGTSLQVYPAAGLIHYRREGVPLYFVDPNPSLSAGALEHLEILRERAAVGLPILANHLIDKGSGFGGPSP